MDKPISSGFVIYERDGRERTNIYGNKMYNESNKPQQSNSSVLELEDALTKVSYPKYIVDFIKQFLIDNYSNDDEVHIYMIQNEDKENIFVIEYCLIIGLNDKDYKIFVLVYLPILFPNYPPEFYIKKISNVKLNDYYLDGKINPNDFKINIDYFAKFDANKNNIPEIIDNLFVNFSKNFPIFKNNNNNDIIKNSGKCFLDNSRANLIKLPKNLKSRSNNQISNRPNPSEKNISLDLIKNNPSVFELKGPFDDKTFLEFIRKQTKDIIGYNYLEFKEKYNIQGNIDNLKTIDKNLKQSSNNLNNLYKKNKQLKSNVQALESIKNKLKEHEKTLEQELNNNNYQNKSFAEKCNKFIYVANEKDMEFLIKIKVMEDYLAYLKKGFEKRIVSFDDMINLTRSLSREIFSMNYVRSKYKK